MVPPPIAQGGSGLSLPDFATRKRLLPHIPYHSRQAFIDGVSPVASDYVADYTRSPTDPSLGRHVQRFLTTVQALVPAASFPRWKRKHSRLVSNIINANTRRLLDDIAKQNDRPQERKAEGKESKGENKSESRSDSKISHNPSRSQDHHRDDEIDPQQQNPEISRKQARAKRANDLASRGKLGKAVQALAQGGLLNPTPEVVDLLRRLHPEGKEPIPRCPTSAPRLTAIDDTILDLCLQKIANGSAPGPSGITGEHVKILCSDSEGICRKMIKCIMIGIINNDLDARTREILLASVLVAAPKPATGDPRPIAIGETLYKLAATYVLELLMDKVASLLKSIQYGVGVPGGAERAPHFINFLIHLYQNTLIITTDFKNAYNSRSRATIARTLYNQDKTQAAWRIFDFAYSLPSTLLVYDTQGHLVDSIISQQGVRQGDPLSSLFYSLSAQPIYEKSIQNTGAEGVADIDDFNIIGPAKQALEAFARLQTECANSPDLVLQLPKCTALWPYASEPPQEVKDECNRIGLTLKRGWKPVLGAPVGDLVGHAFEVRDWLQLQLNEQSPIFDHVLQDEISCQNAARIIRSCGLPRMNFLSRVTPPFLFFPTADAFDDKLQRTFKTKMDLSDNHLGQVAIRQLRLPLNLAGTGLRSYAHTCHAAYLASVLQALPEILPKFNYNLNNFTSACRPLLEIIRSCYEIVKAKAGGRLDHLEDLPSFHSTLVKYAGEAPDQLQRKLVRGLEVAAYDELLLSPAIGDKDKARLRSAASKGASLWMTCDPSTPALTLDDPTYRSAIKTLLAAHPAQQGTCRCGKSINSADHYLTCQSLISTAMTHRHNDILSTLDQHAKKYRVFTRITPRDYSATHEQRLIPDAELHLSRQIVITDVSVTHPTADSYIHLNRPAAALRESEKVRKYALLAERRHARFIPLVLETHGAFGPSADNLFNAISAEESTIGFRPPEFEDCPPSLHLKRCIAVALQRGNARILSAGAQMNAISVAPVMA